MPAKNKQRCKRGPKGHRKRQYRNQHRRRISHNKSDIQTFPNPIPPTHLDPATAAMLDCIEDDQDRMILGIHNNRAMREASNTHPKYKTLRQKAKDGEQSIGLNVANMAELLLKNGAKKLGSFFCNYHISSSSNQNILDNASDIANQLETDPNALEKLNFENVFAFCAKYQGFVSWDSDDIDSWSTVRITKLLADNDITPEPMPSNDVLIQVAKQLIKCKDKLNSMVVNCPDSKSLQQRGRQVMSGYDEKQDAQYSDDENDEKAHVKALIDAQTGLVKNLNPRELPSWPSNKSAKAMFMKRLSQPYSSREHQQMQESLSSIAVVIDTFGVENLDRLPAFMIQDKDQLRGMIIVVESVYLLEPDTPLICVKYIESYRSTMSGKMSRLIGRGIGLVNGSIQRKFHPMQMDLKTIAMISRQFLANRRTMLRSTVDMMEKELVTKWKLSCFVPELKDDTGDKKCASDGCSKYAMRFCVSCRKVAYCSRACQKTHWKASHKRECGKNATE